MHFRLRGNNVQIVRTETDPATKKRLSKPVGSANLTTGEIGDKARAALTPAEVKEVEAWLARQAELRTKRMEVDFQMLPQTLQAMAEWVRGSDSKAVLESAEEVSNAMGRLRFVLGEKGSKPAA